LCEDYLRGILWPSVGQGLGGKKGTVEKKCPITRKEVRGGERHARNEPKTPCSLANMRKTHVDRSSEQEMKKNRIHK